MALIQAGGDLPCTYPLTTGASKFSVKGKVKSPGLVTERSKVVLETPPLPSDTDTTAVWSPRCSKVGVPESTPTGDMASHAGPLTRVKVRGSLFPSVALAAMEFT